MIAVRGLQAIGFAAAGTAIAATLGLAVGMWFGGLAVADAVVLRIIDDSRHPFAPRGSDHTGGILTTVVRVRRERPDDVAAIRRVHNLAFGGDASALTWEARLVDDLRDGSNWIAALSIVAEVEGDVVGHILATRGRLESAGSAIPTRALGLAPVGVLPDLHHMGIGTRMMYSLLGAADALDEEVVCLLGDPAYYARFGFVAASTLHIAPPNPAWTAHFQCLALCPRPLGTGPTTFRYDAAFDREP